MTTESLMTDAAIPEGTGSQTVVTAPAAQAPVTAATTQQQATEGQSAEVVKTDEGVKTEAKTEAPQGAPDKYEFTPAEGQKFDDKVIEQFSEVAKELNLPQEAAQKMLDKVAPVLAARQAEQMEAARNAWANDAKTDKEFGGEHLDVNLSIAKKALDAFGSPELRTLLNESGLGNHPELIRLMVRAGKAISEDKIVTGGTNADVGTRGAAKVLYPNQ